MDALTIIGAIASIIGAYVSIKMALRAGAAAKESRLIKAELVTHRKLTELAQLQASCKKAQKAMAKYGPA